MSSTTSTNYDGLTRNTWPGTWSPSGNHPIVLDTEIRGSLQSITGYPGDRLTDIYGQRLQEGMMVYVNTTYTNGGYTRVGNSYYTYKLLTGEIRNNSTGSSPNAEENWSLFSGGGSTSTSTQGVVGFTGSAGTGGGGTGTGYTGSTGAVGFTGSRGAFDAIGFTGSQGTQGITGGTLFVFQNSGFNYSVDGFADTTFPILTVVRGQTYYFNFTNVTQTHRIALRLSYDGLSINTSAVPGTTGNNPSAGVYGNGSISTIVTYQVPFDASNSIVYQCVNHPSSMIGTINIVDQTGYTGSTGTQGVIGFTGSTGTQGVIGFTGSTGTQGVVGFTGSASTASGYTGSTGTQGVVGFTGSRGAFDAIGFTGSASTASGYTGSTGTQGVVGFTGSASTASGYTGSTGTQGVVGFTGSASTASGYTGSTGTQGVVGFTGSASTASGYTGSTGTQGVVGFTGSRGAFDAIGFTGSAGTGSAITVVGNTTTLTNNLTKITFTGSGVSSTVTNNQVTITITGSTVTSTSTLIAIGNFDGGFPNSNYGGINSIDAGGVV